MSKMRKAIAFGKAPHYSMKAPHLQRVTTTSVEFYLAVVSKSQRRLVPAFQVCHVSGPVSPSMCAVTS